MILIARAGRAPNREIQQLVAAIHAARAAAWGDLRRTLKRPPDNRTQSNDAEGDLSPAAANVSSTGLVRSQAPRLPVNVTLGAASVDAAESLRAPSTRREEKRSDDRGTR